MKETVLIAAAHADDEALGCGGTIARHTGAGDDVAVLFFTNGVGSRDGSDLADANRRGNAMEKALNILGVQRHSRLDFPDNALDSVPLLQITKAVKNFCHDWAFPTIVLTHHPGDLNIDHQVVHRAVMTCFRPQGGIKTSPRIILDFEVLSSTGWFGVTATPCFHPNCFQDISSTLERKLEALAAYGQEMRDWPHARSIEAARCLARFRGATMGLNAAEAFVVERMIC